MIQKLQKDVIQEIGAQQVMASIVDCVKQLIDNSLDAKANKIYIMLEEYGKQKIQVLDNGCGISQQELVKIGTKGNTSKNIDKLQALTLGFRGEAVSCIARISREMIIQSSTSHDCKGNVFDVKKQQIVSTNIYIPKGTKVIIEGIFKYLPVRQNQLKQKQKQFLSQIFELVKQYSLIYFDVSFILTNQKEKKKQTIFQCVRRQGVKQKCWKQRIGQIFGKKIRQKVEYIEGPLIEGFVLNKIESGSSHQNDCIKHTIIKLFIHKRPLDVIPSVKSTLDGIYKKYNKSTKYIAILNIKLDMAYFDVNLTPNKRQIMINRKADQALNQLLSSLIDKQVIQVVPNVNQKQQKKEEQRKSLNDASKLEQKMPLKRQSVNYCIGKQQYTEKAQQKLSKKVINSLNQNLEKRSFMSKKQVIKSDQGINSNKIGIKQSHKDIKENKILQQKEQANCDESKYQRQKHEQCLQPKFKITQFKIPFQIQSEQSKSKKQSKSKSFAQKISHLNINVIKVAKQQNRDNQEQNMQAQSSIQTKGVIVIPQEKQQRKTLKDIIKLDFNHDRPMTIAQQFKRIMDNIMSDVAKKDAEYTQLKEITDQQKQRSISKENFKQFQLLGQFNHGFIPCFFKESLFIVDQHSASQKDKFQTLIQQELSFVQTMDHIKVDMIQIDKIQTHSKQLKEDGFVYQFKKSENQNFFVQFRRYPVAFGKIFNKQYFLEVVQTGKPLRKLDSFQRAAASKACRSAIMVGDVLSDGSMKALVNRLSELNSPWNCPHGRPTTLEITKIRNINRKFKMTK